jgi:hypothetical protein
MSTFYKKQSVKINKLNKILGDINEKKSMPLARQKIKVRINILSYVKIEDGRNKEKNIMTK